jgi:hypothetical protein
MKRFIQLPGFEGIDDGSVRIAPGDYLMKCTGCEQRNAMTSGDPMIVFIFVGKEGKAKNKQFKLYCSLNPGALWKLKTTLQTLGIEAPDTPSKLNPDEVVDIEVIGTVEDHTYEGNKFSRLVAIANSENSTQVKKRPQLTASELLEMNEDELEDVVEKYGLDIDLANLKTLRRKANAIIDGLEEAGLLENPESE